MIHNVWVWFHNLSVVYFPLWVLLALLLMYVFVSFVINARRK